MIACMTRLIKQYALLVCLSLTACASLVSNNSASQIKQLNLKIEYVQTALFEMMILKPAVDDASASTIRVYIEGDGFAWANRYQPSNDPTPKHSVVLSLMQHDDYPNKVYLARPCQFQRLGSQSTICQQTQWWTDARFSKHVINAMHAVLNALKQSDSIAKFELIGYSGGANIAVILAAERNDVLSLRTVAGNLDPDYVNQYHNVSAISDSINAINVADKLKMPQIHFVGIKDEVIPDSVVSRFSGRLKSRACAKIVEVDATHYLGWEQSWRYLVEQPTPNCVINQSS